VPFITGGSRKFTPLKLLSEYSHSLHLKAGRRQVTALERCEDKVMASGLFLNMKQNKIILYLFDRASLKQIIETTN
jgi:hypothetical protein